MFGLVTLIACEPKTLGQYTAKITYEWLSSRSDWPSTQRGIKESADYAEAMCEIALIDAVETKHDKKAIELLTQVEDSKMILEMQECARILRQ